MTYNAAVYCQADILLTMNINWSGVDARSTLVLLRLFESLIQFTKSGEGVQSSSSTSLREDGDVRLLETVMRSHFVRGEQAVPH